MKKTEKAVIPAQATDSPEVLLKVTGLQKHFPITKGLIRRQVGAVKAVDGLDFDVRRGETLGIVGESGCGKSTMGRLITRLLEPTGGSIEFEGKDITHLGVGGMRPLRRDVQMIFQDPYGSLNPRHTVGTIVSAPFKLQKVTPEGGLKAEVQRLLSLVGLNPEHYNRYPHEFSGGQRQRIGIARALALKPKLVVADEPVSALDVSIQAQVVNLLDDLQQELGLTYVIIAHDLSVIRHVSDRIAVMYLGKIVELADNKSLYGTPMHPYTTALMSAVPVPDPRRRGAKSGRILLKGCLLYTLEGHADLHDAGAAAAGPEDGSPGRLPPPGERPRPGPGRRAPAGRVGSGGQGVGLTRGAGGAPRPRRRTNQPRRRLRRSPRRSPTPSAPPASERGRAQPVLRQSRRRGRPLPRAHPAPSASEARGAGRSSDL